jgi:uncharacterized repeat protein (TIGR02543 family)
MRRVVAIGACLLLVPIMFGCEPPAPHLLSTSVVPPGGGTVSPSGGPFTDKVTVVATPAQFYTFVGWAGDAAGTVNPLTLKMNSNKTVVAQFQKVSANVQVKANPSAGGTVRPETGRYEAGSRINITASPASGYRFGSWGTDASGSANPVSIVVDKDLVITGNFIKQYKLSVSADANMGAINPNGGAYDAGTSASLTAIPVFPYAFQRWTGADSEATNPTRVTMNTDKSVSVTFLRLAKKTQAPIQKVGNTYGNAVISIDLNQSEWVEGTIDCDAALPAQAVYIQGPDGQRLKDLGRPGHVTFQFQAAVAGKHDIVVQANYISSWGTTYSVAYTIYGLQ